MSPSKKSLFLLLSLPFVIAFLTIVSAQQLLAQATIIKGEMVTVTGPEDLVTLAFPDQVIYAIDVWGDQDRDVLGVTFLGDNVDGAENIDGYRTDFTHTVTGWETKPEYGDTVDDDNFEEINHDIRWTSNPSGPVGVHFEGLDPNITYTLQLLISGNHQENRKWDIFIEDELVVDEVDSNNDQSYDQGISYAYTYSFNPTDDELNVTFDQGTTGSDGNAILSAVIVAVAGGGVTLGDFNQDGAIDTADFQIIVDNFNMRPKSFFEGDIDFNRTVDLADFLKFRMIFAEGGQLGANATVPEPAALLSLVCGASICGFYGRRRHRKKR